MRLPGEGQLLPLKLVRTKCGLLNTTGLPSLAASYLPEDWEPWDMDFLLLLELRLAVRIRLFLI
ncbi:hypothetical protein ES703_89501 [subsurface metagenome]